MISSVPTSYILQDNGDNEVENVREGYLNDLDFKRYLDATIEEFYYIKLSDYVYAEEKVGIAKDKNSTRPRKRQAV